MDIQHIKQKAAEDISAASTIEEISAIKIKYLGRKQGEVSSLLRALKDFAEEEKRVAGPLIQALKSEIESAIIFKEEELSADKAAIDITIPGKKIDYGHLHPITQTEDDIRQIFNSMNFSVIDGPEMEDEYYNFDALNIPPNHPAREMWDTFWIQSEKKSAAQNKRLLRTHTSPVQIRYMETHNPPFQIISIGKVFRYEATDATHETNFNQVEGLALDKNMSLANFKFVVHEFFRQFFHQKIVQVRFRSSFFPFVEPGVEVDVKLDNSRWLEMGGAGMVHPNVLQKVGYDTKKWQGFAFGFGIERLAMIKHKIPDVRLFASQDLKFIKKF